MRTLTLAQRKGGTGKTTLAASLAVAAAEAGERVFCCDLDPQQSLYQWSRCRKVDNIGVDRCEAAKLDQAINTLTSAGYTLLIVDTPGADSPTVTGAMKAANLVLVPTRPSALDIRAARPTIAAINKLGADFVLVLTQTPPARFSRTHDAVRAISSLGNVAPMIIGHRADHLDAVALGLGVTEYNPAGKAADEIRDLWHFLQTRLGDR